MKRLVLLLACAALAACGGDPAAPRANNGQAEPAPNAAASEVSNEAESPFVPDENASAPAPDRAVVPAAFRGSWAESEALCADRSHPSRLVIEERRLRFHESVMEVARVELLGSRGINIIGTATGEGTTRPAEYHYSLDASGDTLTDEAGGGMVRRRCGG